MGDIMLKSKPLFFPKRIVIDIVVGLAMVFFIMFLWYITQPVTIRLITATHDVAEDMGHNNTYVNTGVTILTQIEYWWGPLLLIGILVVWLFLATQRRDYEGRLE